MKSLLADEIMEVVGKEAPDRVMLLTDSNVAIIESGLIGLLQKRLQSYRPEVIVTPAGEENKTLTALENILSFMSGAGMTRRSMLICIGGGMVTDIGGFAAAVFKRGIRHLNVATTLLGAVDASVGGKTAIDFRGLKNEIGAFHLPVAVLADAGSFGSLPHSEILSGFGEVIKTALISDEKMTRRFLAVDPADADAAILDEACRFCRREKMRIVEADPTEKGLRKVLNFGHTAGHAIESLLIEKGQGLPHGTAIAHGNLVALILSHLKEGMDKKWISEYAHWLRRNYPPAQFTCSDYDRLWTLATHDKKNRDAGHLAYTLISAPGSPVYDRPISRDDLYAALDIYQELLGR
ncbi:MAG: 3-dehydroquinate synthase [Muribaculaceae bacterium]|nr:3-dehydroquinate synthase [Muribaculaceae bacterium]